MNKWIAVKDELPEVSKPVLFTNGEYIDVGFQNERGECYCMGFHMTKKAPTHWMHLPALPNKENTKPDKMQDKIDYLIRTDGRLREMIDALQKRVEKLEESGFQDMKNELIAFKIERNELRERILKLEAGLK